MSKKEIKSLPFAADSLKGISQKTIEIHHGKLYAGYVNKSNEIKDKLQVIIESGKAEGNQAYSELRALKNGEGFTNNGVYLHEDYFAILGGDGMPKGEIAGKLADIIILTAEDPRSEKAEDICEQIKNGIRNKKDGKNL